MDAPLIFVTDDDETNCITLRKILNNNNYRVEVFHDGKELTDRMNSGESPDLILLDLKMPVKDGITSLRELRQNYHSIDLPIIIMTSYDTNENVVENLNEGANDFIGKPISPKILNARIKTQLKLKDLHESYMKEKAARLDQEKYVAIGEMAAGMAHEVNNPLQILLFEGHLINRYRHKNDISEEIDEKLRKIVNVIEKQCERISYITTSLLTYTHSSPDFVLTKWENVTADYFCKMILDHYDNRFKENNINFSIESKCQGLKLKAQRVRLTRALLNILNNAYDAVIPLKKKWIKLLMEPQNNYLNISIIDSGKHVSSKVIENLGQPFLSTKDVGKGQGLGLTVAKSIIEEHKGQLNYSKNKDGNTTFSIKIPMA